MHSGPGRFLVNGAHLRKTEKKSVFCVELGTSTATGALHTANALYYRKNDNVTSAIGEKLRKIGQSKKFAAGLNFFVHPCDSHTPQSAQNLQALSEKSK